MSYQRGSSSESLTCGAVWSLIAISMCACCAAVVSSKWYREEKEIREDAFNAAAPWSSPREMEMSSGWQKWFRFGLQDWITRRSRELEAKEGVYSLEDWNATRAGNNASRAGENGVSDSFLEQVVNADGLIETIMAPLFRPMSE